MNQDAVRQLTIDLKEIFRRLEDLEMNPYSITGGAVPPAGTLYNHLEDDGANWISVTNLNLDNDAFLYFGAGQETAMAYNAGNNRLQITGVDWLFDDVNVTLSSADNQEPVLTIENTNADIAAPLLDFYKNSVSPADGDDMALVEFFGNTSTGVKERFGYILAECSDVTNTDTAGRLRFAVRVDDTDRELLDIKGYNGTVGQAEIIINEPGIDCDTRIESDNQTHMLFVDGGNDALGVRSSNPSANAAALHVPWISGDSSDTAYFGSTNASNNQSAIKAEGYSDSTIFSTTVTGNAIRAETSGAGRAALFIVGGSQCWTIPSSGDLVTTLYNIQMGSGSVYFDADTNTSISGGGADDQIDIEIAGADDFTFTANAFNVLDGSKIKVGTGGDGEIYSSSDDLYIKNVTSNQDIYININDGGVDTNAIKITGSDGSVFIPQQLGVDYDVSGQAVRLGIKAGTTTNSPVGLTNESIQCYSGNDGAGNIRCAFFEAEGTDAASASRAVQAFNAFSRWSGAGNNTNANGFRAGNYGCRIDSSATITATYGIATRGVEVVGGTPTVTKAVGIRVYGADADAGTVTTSYGIDIENGSVAGGAITTQYGINIQSMTAATTNYALVTNAGLVVFNEGGDSSSDLRIEGDTLSYMFFTDASAATENIALLTTAAPNWQAMDRGLFIGNVSTAPTGNPSGGGFLYVSAGALYWRGSGGTITPIAPA